MAVWQLAATGVLTSDGDSLYRQPAFTKAFQRQRGHA
jgi:hypothetical protein